MLVGFVCVIRVSVCPVCPGVCPGSPRCLFTGTVVTELLQASKQASESALSYCTSNKKQVSSWHAEERPVVDAYRLQPGPTRPRAGHLVRARLMELSPPKAQCSYGPR